MESYANQMMHEELDLKVPRPTSVGSIWGVLNIGLPAHMLTFSSIAVFFIVLGGLGYASIGISSFEIPVPHQYLVYTSTFFFCWNFFVFYKVRNRPSGSLPIIWAFILLLISLICMGGSWAVELPNLISVDIQSGYIQILYIAYIGAITLLSLRLLSLSPDSKWLLVISPLGFVLVLLFSISGGVLVAYSNEVSNHEKLVYYIKKLDKIYGSKFESYQKLTENSTDIIVLAKLQEKDYILKTWDGPGSKSLDLLLTPDEAIRNVSDSEIEAYEKYKELISLTPNEPVELANIGRNKVFVDETYGDIITFIQNEIIKLSVLSALNLMQKDVEVINGLVDLIESKMSDGSLDISELNVLSENINNASAQISKIWLNEAIWTNVIFLDELNARTKNRKLKNQDVLINNYEKLVNKVSELLTIKNLPLVQKMPDSQIYYNASSKPKRWELNYEFNEVVKSIEQYTRSLNELWPVIKLYDEQKGLNSTKALRGYYDTAHNKTQINLNKLNLYWTDKWQLGSLDKVVGGFSGANLESALSLSLYDTDDNKSLIYKDVINVLNLQYKDAKKVNYDYGCSSRSYELANKHKRKNKYFRIDCDLYSKDDKLGRVELAYQYRIVYKGKKTISNTSTPVEIFLVKPLFNKFNKQQQENTKYETMRALKLALGSVKNVKITVKGNTIKDGFSLTNGEEKAVIRKPEIDTLIDKVDGIYIRIVKL